MSVDRPEFAEREEWEHLRVVRRLMKEGPTDDEREESRDWVEEALVEDDELDVEDREEGEQVLQNLLNRGYIYSPSFGNIRILGGL